MEQFAIWMTLDLYHLYGVKISCSGYWVSLAAILGISRGDIGYLLRQYWRSLAEILAISFDDILARNCSYPVPFVNDLSFVSWRGVWDGPGQPQDDALLCAAGQNNIVSASSSWTYLSCQSLNPSSLHLSLSLSLSLSLNKLFWILLQ